MSQGVTFCHTLVTKRHGKTVTECHTPVMERHTYNKQNATSGKSIKLIRKGPASGRPRGAGRDIFFQKTRS